MGGQTGRKGKKATCTDILQIHKYTNNRTHAKRKPIKIVRVVTYRVKAVIFFLGRTLLEAANDHKGFLCHFTTVVEDALNLT